VAAHNITAGTPGTDLTRGHALKSVSVTRTSVVPGAISNPAEISSLVVAQPLYAGEQVTLRRFTMSRQREIVGQLNGHDARCPGRGDPNQLLSGTLKTGDHVDLVATSPQTRARAITRHGLSCATSRFSRRNGSATTTSTAPGLQNSVILEVSDSQVQRLFFVLKNADWTLELRPAINAADSSERVETLNSVVTSGCTNERPDPSVT